MITQFFIVFKDYLIEVLPFLAVGFFLSGLIHEFVPTRWVERHLGGKGRLKVSLRRITVTSN